MDQAKSNDYEWYVVCMRQGERQRKFNKRTYLPTVVCGIKTFAADQMRMSKSDYLQQQPDAVTGTFRGDDESTNLLYSRNPSV